MKIIFLDIDGTVNNITTFKKRYYKWKKTGIWDSMLDDTMLKRLKEIVDETGAKIILTSVWRFDLDDNLNPITEDGKNLICKFNEHGLVIYDKLKKIIPMKELLKK